MAIDTTIPRTRRALLAGGIGGLAALVASALGRPLPAEAGSDGDVVLGAVNTATNFTSITNTAAQGTAFVAEAPNGVESFGIHASGAIAIYADGSNRGVIADGGVTGRSSTGWGVDGTSGTSVGVVGSSLQNTGVLGFSGLDAPTSPARTGVYGSATPDASARGVYGRSTAGTGIYGQATSGTGVYATATTGYALRTSGRVRFDKCAGVATISAGSDRVVVSPGIDLVSTSAVVATLQGNAGSTSTAVSRASVNVSTNKFEIILTRAATQHVKVAWHVFG